MKKLLLVSSLLIFFCHGLLHAQVTPQVDWKKYYGGNDGDRGYSIQATSDGGFVCTGSTQSDNGDVTGHHSGHDYWVVKLNSSGALSWQKTLGGSHDDRAYSIKQTSDNGYIVAGFSDSNDGDVSWVYSGDDFWIVKLDVSGNLLWQKSLGGSDDEEAYSVQLTGDGGYVMAGASESKDGDVTNNHGSYDYWIVKLDANGDISWQKSLGGNNDDEAFSIVQLPDGYVAAGWTSSNDGNVTNNHGNKDFWIVKLDLNGMLVWQKSIGGNNDDEARSIAKTNDGGFIVIGDTYSDDGDVAVHNNEIGWVIKISSNGELLWQKFLDAGLSEGEVTITSQKEILITGTGDGEASGNQDYFVAKLDESGNLKWLDFYSGGDADHAHSISETTDGCVVLGESNSDAQGSNGANDFYVVKLSADLMGISFTPLNPYSSYPNPAQSHLTITLSQQDFSSLQSNDLNIHVFDLQGRKMSLPTSNLKSHTSNAIQLFVENLPAGFYTLQIINKKTGVSQAGKFVKD